MSSAVAAATALVIGALVLGLAGCTDDSDGDDVDSESAAETPTATGPRVAVPAGLTLTEPGTALELGQPASVVYTAGSDRASVLTVTVTKVVPGSIRKDFKSFVLEPKQQQMTPYYATATVRNAGPGQLGLAAVPLYGHDSTNTVFPAATLVGRLDACPGGALPEAFGPKASLRTCLVFLVDKGATLESLELRPVDGFDPISWSVPHRG